MFAQLEATILAIWNLKQKKRTLVERNNLRTSAQNGIRTANREPHGAVTIFFSAATFSARDGVEIERPARLFFVLLLAS